MRFLVDMPLSPALAAWLRVDGHDAVHANELSLSGSTDAEILEVPSEQGRVVVTADLDFPRLFAAVGSAGPGLILLRGGNYSEQQSVDAVRRALMAVPEIELPTSIVVIDREKIRRRRLPIQD